MPEDPMSGQIPFGSSEFPLNPEQRCPCMLLLDVSGSMSGAPISELNSGLVTFRDELAADSLAMKRVEVAIVTFGPVQVVNDFQIAQTFIPPNLTASGDTPMGGAIIQAIDLVRQRKEIYRQNGIPFNRPWIFMITDGAPTDDWRPAASRVEEGEARKSFAFYAVGVEGANMDILGQIAVRTPLKLKGLRFRELFVWLSGSMKAVSGSTPDTEVPLQNPAVPEGWATTP